MLGLHSEGSRIALLVQPSNAESPTPMYHNMTHHTGEYNNTPKGAFPLLWS